MDIAHKDHLMQLTGMVHHISVSFHYFGGFDI